jgi:hypothetical protein
MISPLSRQARITEKADQVYRYGWETYGDGQESDATKSLTKLRTQWQEQVLKEFSESVEKGFSVFHDAKPTFDIYDHVDSRAYGVGFYVSGGASVMQESLDVKEAVKIAWRIHGVRVKIVGLER